MTKLSEYRLPFKYDTAYAYGVGRIRALETRMLTRHDFTRLLAVEDIEAFFRILSETEYGMLFPSIPEPRDFEARLQAHLGDVLHLVDHLSRDPDITDLVMSRHDYFNLKVLMKKEVSGREADTLLSPDGLVDTTVLAAVVRGEAVADAPVHLIRACDAARRGASKGVDPQNLDVKIDREMFAYFWSVLKQAKVPFLQGWLERVIDLVNIKTFFRSVWTQEAGQHLKESLVENGSLEIEFYRTLREEPRETHPQRVGATRDARCVDEGISFFRTKGTFARLEQLADGYMITYLRRTALTAFGIEPIMAYAFLKEYEIRALRTLAVGKWNTISQESIRERLPDVYI